VLCMVGMAGLRSDSNPKPKSKSKFEQKNNNDVTMFLRNQDLSGMGFGSFK
jgi:hypothetical protein